MVLVEAVEARLDEAFLLDCVAAQVLYQMVSDYEPALV